MLTHPLFRILWPAILLLLLWLEFMLCFQEYISLPDIFIIVYGTALQFSTTLQFVSIIIIPSALAILFWLFRPNKYSLLCSLFVTLTFSGILGFLYIIAPHMGRN